MVDRRVDCGHALSNRGPARFRKEVGCLQHRLLTTGHREVVDADLSDYFGQIPHSNLLRSIARRVSDGRLLGWVKRGWKWPWRLRTETAGIRTD